MMADGEPLVLGAILRVDLCSWEGPPPLLPAGPICVEDGGPDGLSKSFVYDMLPQHSCISVADACLRLGASIEGLAERWPFRDLAFPARCRLDIGLVAESSNGSWRSNWPVAFLSVLTEAEIELGISHYPAA